MLGSTVDATLMVTCSQRRDDALQLRDARVQILPTCTCGAVGGGTSASIELWRLHDC